LGNFRHEGEGCTGRKNEGAVADQRFLTGSYFFHRKHIAIIAVVRSRPTSASKEVSGAPTHISERLPRFPPLLIATEGRVRHTDMCLARRTVDEEAEVGRFSIQPLVEAKQCTQFFKITS
jgi:hypothetical protein